MLETLALGSKIFGGLLGLRKPKNKGTNFVQLRNNAEAAGFNPLTALQATGGAGFGNVSGPPPLASFDMIASGFSDASSNASGQKDAELRQLELSNELMQLELDNSNTQGQRVAASARSPIAPLSRQVDQFTARPAPRARPAPIDNEWSDPELGGYEAEAMISADDKANMDVQFGDRTINGADGTQLQTDDIPIAAIEDDFGEAAGALAGVQRLPDFYSQYNPNNVLNGRDNEQSLSSINNIPASSDWRTRGEDGVWRTPEEQRAANGMSELERATRLGEVYRTQMNYPNGARRP